MIWSAYRRLILCLVGIIGLGLLGSVFVLGRTTSQNAVSDRFPLPSITQTVEKQITISAVGDCVLGTDDRFRPSTSFNYYRNILHKPDSYFFSGVYNIFSKDDLTIANSECVIATKQPQIHKPQQQGGSFWFRGDADNANIYAAGSVEAVNLANNHSFDFGEAGLQETIANLEHAGVAPFGNGLTQIIVRKGIKIGLLGYCVMGPLEQGVNEEALKTQIADDLDAMHQKADLCIVTFHWGVEKMYLPNEQQRRLGHFAVDHGANLVLGHHPHVLQPIENYKGVNIVYSLGDFAYGGSARVLDKDTMIFQQTFRFRGTENQLIGQSSHVIPCLVHEALLNDYRPVLASQVAASDAPSMPMQLPPDFVDVNKTVPNVIVDLQYATSENPYNHQFYSKQTCYLRRAAADRLREASVLASAHGLRLKVWDAYRPYSTQRDLRRYVSDPRWIAQGISNHNRGMALDVTLVGHDGKEIEMGTGFDTFSAKTPYDGVGLTKTQSDNRHMLREMMMQAGFRPLSTEWWHFDAPYSHNYGPVNAPI